MSRLRTFLAVLAVLGAAACGDNADQSTPTTAPSTLAPTIARSASAAPADSSSEIVSLPEDAAPICHAYLERRDVAKAQLAQSAGDADLIYRVEQYNRFLNANCR